MSPVAGRQSRLRSALRLAAAHPVRAAGAAIALVLALIYAISPTLAVMCIRRWEIRDIGAVFAAISPRRTALKIENLLRKKQDMRDEDAVLERGGYVQFLVTQPRVAMLPALERVAATEQQIVHRSDAISAIRQIFSDRGWLQDRSRMESLYRRLGEKAVGEEIWATEALMPEWDEFLARGEVLAMDVRRHVMRRALGSPAETFIGLWTALLYLQLDPDKAAEDDIVKLAADTEDWRVRAIAHCALLRYGRAECVPHLARFLQLTTPSTLPDCGPEGQAWLCRALEDTQPAVAQYVRWQLTGGRPPPPFKKFARVEGLDLAFARALGRFLEVGGAALRYDAQTGFFECEWGAALTGTPLDTWDTMSAEVRRRRANETLVRCGPEWSIQWEHGGFEGRMGAVLHAHAHRPGQAPERPEAHQGQN